MQDIPLKDRNETIELLCLKYAPWFFEMLSEVIPGKRTVLELFQIAYLTDDARFKITNKTRQAGGSLVVSMDKFYKAYTRETYKCDVISINRAEAQGKITYIRNLWESLPMRWRSPLSTDNTEKIGFHVGRRASEIRSIAASSGVRGGRKDIVFDEAAHIATFEENFVAALPATVREGGNFDVISTPYGMQGKYHEIYKNITGQFGDWSRHEFIWIDVTAFCTDCVAARLIWKSEYDSNPEALHGEIYDAFATNDFKEVAVNFTQEQFLQEFCGVFVDESASFFPYALINHVQRFTSQEEPAAKEHLDLWVVRPDGNDNVVYMGIDFAEGKKGGDSTSIQLLERLPNGHLMLRFSQDLEAGKGWNDFDRQLGEINGIIDRFRPTRCSVDETGLGRTLAQDLKNRWGGVIDPVTFQNANKEQMALGLKKLMEDGRIWIPKSNRKLEGQIHNIKRKITPMGNIQYFGEPHDDMFWALALAAKGTTRLGFRVLTI